MAKPNSLFYRFYIPVTHTTKGRHLKTTIILSLLLLASSAFADLKYYPADLASKFNTRSLKNDSLKAALNNVLTSNHQKDNKSGTDSLGCNLGTSNCYGQVVLGYQEARKIMFGKMYLKTDSSGNYITDVYCQKRFGTKAGVGPDRIPDGTKINCEHTWPQSKFTSAYPTEMQKSDLHHLFPSDSKANSIRGNDNFTEVTSDNGDLSNMDCSSSKFGNSTTASNDGFEPPLTHKGNVARALFYFSVRYKMPIPQAEEEVLRRWNDLDPVDQDEMDRNEAIQAVQGNRNPFIDFPTLANDINKF